MSGLSVYVTRELFPFTPGGIGRVIANLLDATAATEGERRAVVYLGNPLDTAGFAARFPGVLLIDASPSTYALRQDGFRYPPAEQYTTHFLHAESVRVMQVLKRLESAEGPLLYVEFPDWGGCAFAPAQEKLLGLAFQQATLAVRLHTSDSMLSATESKPVDAASLALYDLERKALADCDLLIGQVDATARAMQAFFDFEDSEWLPRLVIDAPPVLLDQGAPASSSITPGPETPIVFSSKIQRIKRPDVFVRGCCDFLHKTPAYRGTVHLLAMAPDGAYLSEIRRLVPPSLASRFSFDTKADSATRFALIRQSVCIFPGTFESFCLAAYEASLSGALPVVSDANPAFSSMSPWENGVNCVKFDGTPAGLCGALERVFDKGSPVAVASASAGDQMPAAISRARQATSQAPVPTHAFPLVSVLIPHHNLGAYLAQTVENALTARYANIEVIVIDDASSEPASREAVTELARRNDPRVRVIETPQNRGLAATRNLALANARGNYALTLDADDLIDPAFIAIAVEALERHPGISFVVPQTAYFDDAPDADPANAPWTQCMTFVGEARASGFFQNRFSTASIMGRVDALRSLPYNESLSAYEDWDMYMRAVMARMRFVVTNGVHFYYRRRVSSMIHGDAASQRLALYYHDMLRDKQIRVGRNVLPMYLLEAASGAGRGESLENLRARLAAYEQSTVVIAALRLRDKADHMPRWAIRALKRFLRILRRSPGA